MTDLAIDVQEAKGYHIAHIGENPIRDGLKKVVIVDL